VIVAECSRNVYQRNGVAESQRRCVDEDPGFHQALRVFTFVGAKSFPKVDRPGGNRLLAAIAKRAAAANHLRNAFTSISPWDDNEFPPRTPWLVDLARTTQTFIFEDDYDSEFRFTGLHCLPFRGSTTVAV